MNDQLAERHIEVKVTSGQVMVQSGEGAKDVSRAADLSVPEDQKERVRLLDDLLRNAIDFGNEDQLQQGLYHRLLRVLGRELFDLLFKAPELRQTLLDELGKAANGKNRLRIRLSFIPAQQEEVIWLSGLPWEYLHTPAGNDALGLKGEFLSVATDELLFSRRLEIAGSDLGVDLLPLEVLLVGSSPTFAAPGEKPLEPLDMEAMQEALTELDEESHLIRLDQLIELKPPTPDEDPRQYEWQATRAEFEKRIDQQPVLVHFMGHGRCRNGKGELALAHSNGTPDWIDEDAFTRMVTGSKRVKAVFLQACESAMLPDPYVGFSGVAQSLAARGIPVVVAMQYRVPLAVAQKFALKFYEALTDPDTTVDAAVQLARRTLRNQAGDVALGMPVVYLSAYSPLTRRSAPLLPGPAPRLGALVAAAKANERAVPGAAVANGDSEGSGAGHCTQCGKRFAPSDRYCANGCGLLPWHCRNCGVIFDEDPGAHCFRCEYLVGSPPAQDDVSFDTVGAAAANLDRAMRGPGSDAG